MEQTRETEALLLGRQLCFPLYAAARKVMSAYTPALRGLGLTYTQYIVMLALWEEDPLSVGELCRRLYLDSGTLTPLLKKLEAAGLVRRSRSGCDERVVEVSLTQAGRALRAHAVDVPKTVGACLHLSGQEAGQLYALLYRVLENTAD